mgnify:CR=1 FL=1
MTPTQKRDILIRKGLEKKVRSKKAPTKESTKTLIEGIVAAMKDRCPNELNDLLYVLHSETFMPNLGSTCTDEEIVHMVWAKQGLQLMYDKFVAALGDKNNAED